MSEIRRYEHRPGSMILSEGWGDYVRWDDHWPEVERLKADIARLTAERDEAVKAEPPTYTFQGFTYAVPMDQADGGGDAMGDIRNALHASLDEAEVEALRRDARRYRWLRGMIYDDRIIVAADEMLHGEALDAAIDEAAADATTPEDASAI